MLEQIQEKRAACILPWSGRPRPAGTPLHGLLEACRRGWGPGLTCTPAEPARAVLSCAPAPPRQGNCTLELQSDCLAQQLNAREMEQKAATSHWPRPCRESGMHTCPGRAWLCAHAHVLTLTLSVSGCTVLTSAARATCSSARCCFSRVPVTLCVCVPMNLCPIFP